MDNETAKPKRGRPPGSDETPEALIRKELNAHLKLYRKLRETVEKRIEAHGDTLTAEELTKYMDLLRRGLVELAKPIVAPAKADNASGKGEVEEDAEKILKGLLEGNGRL